MAQASDERLDLGSLSGETGASVAELDDELRQLERMRLMLLGQEKDEPPFLLAAGRQFLAASGDVPDRALLFLATVVDDLHARAALFDARVILVDDFRFQFLNGDPVTHAAGLVPPAFAGAVDAAFALDLFAASVALMVRIGGEGPAGCVAEEILAVGLLGIAEDVLRSRQEAGAISESQLSAASGDSAGSSISSKMTTCSPSLRCTSLQTRRSPATTP